MSISGKSLPTVAERQNILGTHCIKSEKGLQKIQLSIFLFPLAVLTLYKLHQSAKELMLWELLFAFVFNEYLLNY